MLVINANLYLEYTCLRYLRAVKSKSYMEKVPILPVSPGNTGMGAYYPVSQGCMSIGQTQ